jgi:hypothetical protein
MGRRAARHLLLEEGRGEGVEEEPRERGVEAAESRGAIATAAAAWPRHRVRSVATVRE